MFNRIVIVLSTALFTISICSYQSKRNSKHLSQLTEKGGSEGLKHLKRGKKQPQMDQFGKRQANIVRVIIIFNANIQETNLQVSNTEKKDLRWPLDLLHIQMLLRAQPKLCLSHLASSSLHIPCLAKTH